MMSDSREPLSFSLENFKGPLHFLLHLVQRKEIEVTEVPIVRLIDQYLEKASSHQKDGSEFIGSTSFLTWMKSAFLLPNGDTVDEEGDGHFPFDVFEGFAEYCAIKEKVDVLKSLEEKAHGRLTRPKEKGRVERGFLAPTLEDLVRSFKEALAKASLTKKVDREEWTVEEAIDGLIDRMQQRRKLQFEDIFDRKMARPQMVVYFLAILELVKMGKVSVGKGYVGIR